MAQPLLDHNGNPLPSSRERGLAQKLYAAKREVLRARQAMQQAIQGRYDAAQTVTGNVNHWANADNLDPHAANTLAVRRVLRSRSRYEIIENNPYLKGTLLTLAADFVGSGPKLQITDKRIPPPQRQQIEYRFAKWCKRIRFRQKLWRMIVAKIVDGESFAVAYTNRRSKDPVKLDWQVIECDRVTDPYIGIGMDDATGRVSNDIDGIKIDAFENPLEYFILDSHPGASAYLFSVIARNGGGRWAPADEVIHWFRQDRGWLRGIPEIASSLPLCAVLRRYTLAVCRHAEVAADFTAIIESEAPAAATAWTSGGELIEDDPFDTFPVEMGMITNLPWGYTMKQLNPVPSGVQYDEYVGSVLREIIRPLCVPHNIASGTSKDSNMSSAVVDTHIYRGGQNERRFDCAEVVLDPVADQWWKEAILQPDYLMPGRGSMAFSEFRDELPDHVWRWDQVGLEHTDPQKVAQALAIMHDKGFITDRDIQEGRFNRSVEEWQEEKLGDAKYRSELEKIGVALLPEDDGADSQDENSQDSEDQ